MTVINPKPTNTSSVEPKVSAATIGAYVLGVIGLILVQVFTDDDNALLIAVLPDPVEAFVLPLIPAVAAFVFGFAAKHQWRVPPNAVGGAPGSREAG